MGPCEFDTALSLIINSDMDNNNNDKSFFVVWILLSSIGKKLVGSFLSNESRRFVISPCAYTI